MSEKRWLGLILVLFGLLGTIYAVVTPPFEASDELWHYPMVRHLADGNPLPVQDAANVGPWKQEASQPPLYYYLAALLTFWVDTSDWQEVRWLNPHVDSGVITADGNVNLAVHDPAVSQWQGTLLAVMVVRLASVVMSAGTVYFTYQIAKTLTSRPEIRLGAAALNAFLPMFLFISGSVNNDNLAILLTSWAVWLMIGIVQRADRWQWREMVGLGLVMGCAALTKEGSLALFPLSAGSLFIAAWRYGGRPTTWQGLLKVVGMALGRWLAVVVPALLVAGWWYWRNVQLYGDWLGWNAFLAVLGQRAHPASLAQLWDERWGLLISYWGLFGGLNVAMPNWIYILLNGVLLLGLLGSGIYLFQLLRQSGQSLLLAEKVGLERQIFAVLRFVESQIAWVLCLLLTGAVVYGLVQWATVTWSSQGRLLFTAISALNILWVLGLVGWMPAHFARPILALFSFFLFTISALAPFLWIQPAYQPPVPAQTDLTHSLELSFGQQIRLNGYELDKTTAQAGEKLTVRLAWEAIAPMQRDWSIFVHLVDPVLGVPIAQRDMYLGRGLLPTRLLSVGQKGVDEYILTLPATAIAPAKLKLVVGFYDFYAPQERLLLANGQDVAELAMVDLQPVAGTVPNPVTIFFENGLQLTGFELSERVLQPTETTQLTLYWRIEQPLTTDYTFFAQLLGTENHRWAAADIPMSTTTWQMGEVQAVVLPLTLTEEVPASVYPLIIGVYTLSLDGTFDRLQTLTSEGRLTDDFVQLTHIRVER